MVDLTTLNVTPLYIDALNSKYSHKIHFTATPFNKEGTFWMCCTVYFFIPLFPPEVEETRELLIVSCPFGNLNQSTPYRIQFTVTSGIYRRFT